MKKELADLIGALPEDTKEAEWIFMIKYSGNTLDIVSNIPKLEQRRQLLASVDQTWLTLIEEDKRKSKVIESKTFVEGLRSHYDERE